MGDVYQQAMLNDMQAHNDVQCFNDQKYNAATGSTCCCQLVRTNRYVGAYLVCFLVSAGIMAGALQSCSIAVKVIVSGLAIIVMWVGWFALFLESKWVLAPLFTGEIVEQQVWEGSTLVVGPTVATQTQHVKTVYENFDPYRDPKRFGLFCVLWTIGIIVSQTQIDCPAPAPQP